MSIYPASPAERDSWIVARRGEREAVSAERPHAFLLERERFVSGEVGNVATVFLTNRECPWRCAMCDLWRHTRPNSVAPGQIPEQIAYALKQLGAARQIKLYNSGSFFDPRAIPPEDYPAIAELVQGFERVIVECHPAMVGAKCLAFRDRVSGELEVAMGLETVHPTALEKLNKRMTLDDYARAAEWLAAHGIALRAFVIVGAPFQPPEEAIEWACRSVDFAQDCGATAVTLIPARAGNGAMEALAAAGEWRPPLLAELECAMEYGLRQGRGRIFADLWGLEGVQSCASCKGARVARLGSMNLEQTVLPAVECTA